MHPFIVQLHAAWKDSKYVYLALEWAPRGNLFDYLVAQVRAVGRVRQRARGARFETRAAGYQTVCGGWAAGANGVTTCCCGKGALPGGVWQ